MNLISRIAGSLEKLEKNPMSDADRINSQINNVIRYLDMLKIQQKMVEDQLQTYSKLHVDLQNELINLNKTR